MPEVLKISSTQLLLIHLERLRLESPLQCNPSSSQYLRCSQFLQMSSQIPHAMLLNLLIACGNFQDTTNKDIWVVHGYLRVNAPKMPIANQELVSSDQDQTDKIQHSGTICKQILNKEGTSNVESVEPSEDLVSKSDKISRTVKEKPRELSAQLLELGLTRPEG